MKHIFTLLALFVMLQAQSQIKPLSDIISFKSKLEQTAKTIKSIECDFIQKKHLDVFKDNDVTLKGKFYYKYSNKICLDYTNSINYIIVINGNKIKTVNNNKKTIMSLGSNKTMKEMQGMITACMSGDLTQLSSDYDTEYFEDTNSYLIIVKPKNKIVKDYISDFHIYLDKKDMSVEKLRISENSTDYSEYNFINKKFNTLQNDENFSIN